MSRSAVSLRIEGRVQGVGYRWWACGEARRLGLDGWVRNRVDGTVELTAAGRAQAVERLISACAEGPPAAMVEAVERFETEVEGLSGFEQRPTGR